jgi:lactate dehydrogenase-like 2-hydroxyacid dehydrogenase
MEHFSSDFFHPTTTPNLRLAIQFGVGLERVDVAAATKEGIAISNIPADGTGNAEATSEHAMFLTMSLLRYATTDLNRRFQNQELGGLPAPRTVYRKNVTVVGFGSVGKVLTRYLIHMGAHVTVVRNRSWESITADEDSSGCHDTQLLTEKGSKASSLDEALPTTDVLILAVTMTPETLHLMNHETISLLPRGALIVNVGRGPLVEYGAIRAALTSGAVGGFASDVGVGGHPTAPSEPWDPKDELSQLENTLFTPHVGGYTDYSYDKMANKIVDAIECVMRGDPPPVWVNAAAAAGSDQP